MSAILTEEIVLNLTPVAPKNVIVRHSADAGNACECGGCAGSRAARLANGPTIKKAKKRGF